MSISICLVFPLPRNPSLAHHRYLRMRFETGIEHPLHVPVTLQKFGHVQGSAHVVWHPHVQSAHPTERHVTVERAWHHAGV